MTQIPEEPWSTGPLLEWTPKRYYSNAPKGLQGKDFSTASSIKTKQQHEWTPVNNRGYQRIGIWSSPRIGHKSVHPAQRSWDSVRGESRSECTRGYWSSSAALTRKSGAREQRNREHDEIELLASPLHATIDAGFLEAAEEMLPRSRRCPSDMDEVNPEWIHWQYPELPPTPEDDHTALAEPNEGISEASQGARAEDPGALGKDAPIVVSSEDEEEADKKRRTPEPVVSPDNEDIMPFTPLARPDAEPEVIVISDDEDDEERRGEGGGA
ncbi:GH17175 [Drosophila grimshawi]|uniref:GH17175 n=1 Tax=Drosophila grimshawi TaxID=7222 RepID=B4J1A5_DROGR|nr:GH17175 [Drosophila grimshawi]